MKMLSKIYESQLFEDALYKEWEESEFFDPDICIQKGIIDKNAKPFSIILPPPNATGILHIGHSTMLAIEDLLVRYHRMKGDRTLWLPGTDHAALATQEKVERLLWENEKKTRHDLGREQFLKEVSIFVEKSRDTMRMQMRKMGCSLDWSREAFTLDQKRNIAVNTAFKKMFDDGIIYRGDRIVNWDPNMQTTVSDDEIEWKEESIPFYYFQYGPFVIGTSRPETKFGDKYIVVHPDDQRYTKYKHGETFEVEWIGKKKIKATLIKDSAVDPEFGSGAMTITPWHDAIDFEIAQRHHLDCQQIIGYDGKMLFEATGKDFSTLDIFQARKKIVEKLKEKKLLVNIEENYIHNIAINSRGGGCIEPQIKRQWFVDVNKTFTRNGKEVSLKSLMQKAVRSKKIDIVPERFEKTYFHWVDNLRDWCISRQIWYGHRIPVWYRDEEIYCGITPPNEDGWYQDPDTLDTWFSSGLWTFSTLGWPEKTKDLKTYHPTSVMETGYDILFFWVARMILMSTYLLDEIPFKTVYLHGLVRDEQGRKMSKSLGNVIDPLTLIPKYGTDAIRLSLLIGSTPGNDLRLGEEKIAQYRNFTNKLWNIARFILSQKKEDFLFTGNIPSLSLDSSHFILSQMATLIKNVTSDIDTNQFSQAGEKLRDFTWNMFADWYIEMTKFEENREETQEILFFIFKDLLKLWHPFMPFVTEALWKEMGYREHFQTMLFISPWPKEDGYQKKIDPFFSENFSSLLTLTQAIRGVRSQHHLTPNKKISLILCVTQTSSEFFSLVQRNLHLIAKLKTGVEKISLQKGIFSPKTKYISHAVENIFTFHIPLLEIIDTEKEKLRLEKEKKEIIQCLFSINKRLKNPAYKEKAPQNLVKETQQKQKELLKRKEEIEQFLKAII
ncbi:MAG: valine--tRNA ligase [Candidatus Moranbacteria bacterium]|nr:valine--tRNA ligase [Candidatus Moranbacteria bacterium]